MNPVTDQAILDQLNGKPAGGMKPVTDPRLLMKLDGVPDSVIGGDSNAYVQQVIEAHKRHDAGEPVANIKKSLNEALAKQPAIHGQPKPPQAQGWGDYLGGTVGSLASSITMGGFDEGLAALAAGLGRNTYDQNLAQIRGQQKAFADANPVTDTMANIGGSFLIGIPGFKALGTAVEGAPIAYRALATGGMASLAGGTQGFLSGEGEGRLGSALLGAGLGGTVGALAPLAGAAIGNSVSRLRDYVPVDRALKSIGLNRGAAKMLEEGIQADAPQGLDRIKAAGFQAMPVDSGQGASGVLDLVMQSGGKGASVAFDAIEKRAAAQEDKVTRALDMALGHPAGIDTMQEALRAEARPINSAAYNAAYSQPVDYSTPIGQDILKTITSQVPRSAIRAADELMRSEGVKSTQTLLKVGPDGKLAFETLPDLRTLDYITRGLNAIAKKTDAQGAMGGQTEQGASYLKLSSQIRSALKDMIPEYETALDGAAGFARRKAAVELGADLLKPSTTREAIAMAIHPMTGMEKGAVASGIRSHIDELLNNIRTVASDPNMDSRQANAAINALSSNAAREKVGMVIGWKPAQELFAQIDDAAKAIQLRASLARNSRTFARQSAEEARKALAQPGPLGKAAMGDLPGAGKSAIAHLTGATPEWERARLNQGNEMLARFLTQPRGEDAVNAVQKLTAALRAKAANKGIAKGIERKISSYVPALAIAPRGSQSNQ